MRMGIFRGGKRIWTTTLLFVEDLVSSVKSKLDLGKVTKVTWDKGRGTTGV